MPKVSFIVPNKDKAIYLPEAIESLRNQTLKDIEVIIVDNDSIDDSRDIIDTFVRKDNRIVKVYTSISGDVPVAERIDKARNEGNKIANSNIICVADSDDVYLPRRAELTYETLAQQKDCGFFYGAFYQRNQYGDEDARIPCFFPSVEFSKRRLKKGGLFFIGHVTVGYKKELILKYPYNSKGVGVGDWGMLYNFLVLHNIKPCFTKEPVTIYRVYGNSLKELSWDKYCDKEKTNYLWEKKQKKMELLGGLRDI